MISIFSYTSRNYCQVIVNVLRMTERRRWVSHSGSNPRRQTSTTQGYKSWSHGMTNVSIPEVNMFNSSTLAVSVTINLLIWLGFVSVNSPGKHPSWTRYVLYIFTQKFCSHDFWLDLPLFLFFYPSDVILSTNFPVVGTAKTIIFCRCIFPFLTCL